MTWFRFDRRLVAAGLLLFAVACSSDSNAPAEISDPAATLADFEAIGDVFSAPQFAGYGAVSSYLSSSGVAASRTLGRVLQLTTPDASLLRGRTFENEQRAAELRALAPSFSVIGAQGPIIPDNIAGKTFEWNVDSAGYVATGRAGAAATGIRFIIYAIDPLTGEPSLPLTETGYVDIIDESTASSARVHLLVKGLSGTPTFLDYTATGTPTATGGTITAAGFVSNGGTRRLDFDVNVSVSETQTSATIAFDVSFDVSEPNVSIDLSFDFIVTQTSLTQVLDFTFRSSSETISILGEYANTETGSTYDFDVRVNGGLFATITGDENGVQVADENGDPLSEDELALLETLFYGWESVVGLALEVLEPAFALLGLAF